MDDQLINQQVMDAIGESILKKIKSDKRISEKTERDWRLRNTKLLLKNYHILKEHCVGIDADLECYADSIFDPTDVRINSIMASKGKTRKMIWYIDEMLEAYKRYTHSVGGATERRYATLWGHYINGHQTTYSALASSLDVSEVTVRRDLIDAINEFSVFLFGLNAIEDLENDQKLSGQ